MKNRKYYVQPLGFLRGLTVSSGNFRRLVGGEVFYSTLKIITRDDELITSEMISIDQIDGYLKNQPDDKSRAINKILCQLDNARAPLNEKINWQTPVIQGVLNVTPDSFSDGGKFDNFDRSINQAQNMINAGAMIIDVGGESTKPGAKPVSIESEKKRVLPVIKKLASMGVMISIDSRNAEVMDAAIKVGAHIINDVSALEHDPKSLIIAKKTEASVMLMHAQGSPENMQDNPNYKNVVLDIYDYLQTRINACLSAGISKDKIIIDPGIGFGKTVEHNLQILANMSLFHGLGVPVMIGVSRKSFIGKITGEELASRRVFGSIAAAQISIDQGVQIIRVHDVSETKQAFSIHQAIFGKNSII